MTDCEQIVTTLIWIHWAGSDCMDWHTDNLVTVIQQETLYMDRWSSPTFVSKAFYLPTNVTICINWSLLLLRDVLDGLCIQINFQVLKLGVITSGSQMVDLRSSKLCGRWRRSRWRRVKSMKHGSDCMTSGYLLVLSRILELGMLFYEPINLCFSVSATDWWWCSAPFM